MKNKIIAGNWKMNKTRKETEQLITELVPLVKDTNNTVIICVPYTDLDVAVRLTKGTNIHVGAENCHWAESGAYTGEISADMLDSYDVKYCIIGHSERRQYFGETDETVNLRRKTCLKHGIHPIICVGENLEQREKDITKEVIKAQIEKDLAGFTEEDMLNTIIAYEPIWAIGTGKTATAQQAEEVCGYIRSIIANLFGNQTAEGVTIQYGGSMNAKNAKELLSMENIDGGLIGGASLKADDFAQIVSRVE